MRAVLGGAFALALVSLAGCREVVLDPSARHQAPVVEEADAAFDEDAATPPPEVAPVPAWAEDDAPPPAFPPPP